MRYARLLIAASVLAFTLNPALAPTPAAAQPASAPFPCKTNINIVRVSEIKPGMMQKFLDAVAGQQAWYKSKGVSDQITVNRVLVQDPATKAWSLSDTQAVTNHIEPASREHGPAHDDAYNAFVALFRDSSSIKTELITCMDSM